MPARLAAAALMGWRCRRGFEFVSRNHTHFYLKMESYHNEHR